MAGKTQTRSKTSRTGGRSGGGEGSAFSWSANTNAGVLIGAAVAGAAVGLAANVGRKLFVQFGAGGIPSDWFDALRAEHEATLALFDKIEATREDQTTSRSHLLAKLKSALTRHAQQEEAIVYPALRQANLTHDADALNAEHGCVKTYLYELENLAKDSPDWLARIRDFRAMLQEHMRMEEDEVFPAFRKQLSEEQNAKLTAAMNKEGFRAA